MGVVQVSTMIDFSHGVLGHNTCAEATTDGQRHMRITSVTTGFIIIQIMVNEDGFNIIIHFKTNERSTFMEVQVGAGSGNSNL